MMAFMSCMLLAVAFNTVAGATLAVAVGLAPMAGAVAGNVVGLTLGQVLPQGITRAGVFTEIWTGEMIKAFRTDAESLGWMQRIRSYNQHVKQDVIHFTEIGGDPKVLVNNKTYPLSITALEDADKPISLDKFDTEATPVTDDELHAISYDKMASVQERHRDALREAIAEKAIHAIAPEENLKDVPVLKTTGEGGAMVPADLIAIKRAFDKMKVPKKDRILVLSSDHVNDLLITDRKFKEQYNINTTDGKIGRLYGFDIYEYDGTPYYTKEGKKLAWGSLPGEGDVQASVAFYAGRMMKAYGSTTFYYSDSKTDTLYHRSLVNFRQWGICLPLTNTGSRAAIISAGA